MGQGRHGTGPGTWGVAGALAGGVLLAVAGVGLWLNERGDGPVRASAPTATSTAAAAQPPADAPTPSSTSSSSTSASPASVPAALRDCADAVRVAERVLAEAGTGADHWRRHVQAYRDLVDGRIPYAEADREWRVTREAGPDDVRRFQRAERAYDEDACDSADRQAPAELSATAEACAERGDAAAAAVSRGARVMAQWDGHLVRMAAEASHQITDARARELFRVAVREAPERLDAFVEAQDELEGTPPCEVPGA